MTKPANQLTPTRELLAVAQSHPPPRGAARDICEVHPLLSPACPRSRQHMAKSGPASSKFLNTDVLPDADNNYRCRWVLCAPSACAKPRRAPKGPAACTSALTNSQSDAALGSLVGGLRLYGLPQKIITLSFLRFITGCSCLHIYTLICRRQLELS